MLFIHTKRRCTIKIGELFVKLFVKAETKDLESFRSNVNTTATKLGVMAAAAIATAVAMNKVVDSATKGTVALENFNKQTGLSIANLQKWQVAGQLSDTSLTFEEIAGSIKSIQLSLAQIDLGKEGNVGALKLLGIENFASKDAFELLDSIRESIVGLEDSKVSVILQDLGISPKFINVLRLTNEEFDQLSAQKFLSKEQRTEIVKLGTALTKFNIGMTVLKDKILAGMSQSLINVISFFTNLKDLLVLSVEQWSEWAEKSDKVSASLKIFVALLIAAAVVLNPIPAVIAAILLAMEDLFNFMEGKKSILGDIVKDFKEIDKITKRTATSKDNDFFSKLQNFSANVGFATVGGLVPFLPGAGKATSNSANINNNYNINSTQDSRDLADEIVEQQQKQLNYTLSDFNNEGDS